MEHTNEKNSSPSEKKRRVTNYCCVPQCSTYFSSAISLYFFPKNKELKKKWERTLKMGKPASSSMRVCSQHFLPKDYFPGSK